MIMTAAQWMIDSPYNLIVHAGPTFRSQSLQEAEGVKIRLKIHCGSNNFDLAVISNMGTAQQRASSLYTYM